MKRPVQGFVRTLAIIALMAVSSVAAFAQWTTISQTLPNNTTYSWAQLVVYGDKLYMFGGLTTAVTKDVWTLDTKTQGAQWTKVATMPTGRCSGYATVINNKIYLVAGASALSTSATMNTTTLEFDPATNKFATKKAITTGVYQVAGAVVDSKIYVIGGLAGTAYKNTVQVYDPVADTWSTSTAIPLASAYGTATANGSDIYLLAGSTAASSFNTNAYKGTVSGSTITWAAIAPYPLPVTRAATGTLNGSVFAAAGATTNGVPLGAMYKYDDAAKKWNPAYYLPTVTYNTSVLPSDGTSLYFTGGYASTVTAKFTEPANPVAVAVVSPLSLTYDRKTGTEQTQTIMVGNAGPVPLTVTIETPEKDAWLMADAITISVTPFTSSPIAITANSDGMKEGSYSSSVKLITNDPLLSTIDIPVKLNLYDAVAKRRPFLEVFTSETCPPCKPGNENLHSIINQIDRDNYVVVKYQQDFPGNGDPYCTGETVARRGFYAINSIPRMEIDGGWDGNANSFTQGLYDAAVDITSLVTIKPTYSVNGKTVKASVSIEPLWNNPSTDLVLYVAIAEKFTNKNINSQTNGETEFYDVVKKMLPDQNGTPISALTRSNNIKKDFEFTFNGDYTLPADGKEGAVFDLDANHTVESFDSLEVVAWVQDSKTKQVVNAAWGVLGSGVSSAPESEFDKGLSITEHYPLPAGDLSTINFYVPKEQHIELGVFNVRGEKVATLVNGTMSEGTHSVKLDATKLANGAYTLWLTNNSKNVGKAFSIVR